MKDVMDFNEDYKNYISLGKTERLCVKESIKMCEAAGFKNIKVCTSFNPGDKVYAVN